MNKQDKIIIIFYIFIAVSYPSFLIYADYSFKNEITIIDLWPKIEETHNFDHTKIVNVNKKTIFNVLTDVEGYTKVLPNNVLSVKIIILRLWPVEGLVHRLPVLERNRMSFQFPIEPPTVPVGHP